MKIRVGDIVEAVPHTYPYLPEKALVMDVVKKQGKQELTLHFEFADSQAWFEAKKCKLLQRCPIRFKKREKQMVENIGETTGATQFLKDKVGVNFLTPVNPYLPDTGEHRGYEKMRQHKITEWEVYLTTIN